MPMMKTARGLQLGDLLNHQTAMFFLHSRALRCKTNDKKRRRTLRD